MRNTLQLRTRTIFQYSKVNLNRGSESVLYWKVKSNRRRPIYFRCSGSHGNSVIRQNNIYYHYFYWYSFMIYSTVHYFDSSCSSPCSLLQLSGSYNRIRSSVSFSLSNCTSSSSLALASNSIQGVSPWILELDHSFSCQFCVLPLIPVLYCLSLLILCVLSNSYFVRTWFPH